MQSLHFTAGTSSNGVIERDFTVGEVTGNSLVGRIRRPWRAPGTDGPRQRPAQDSTGDAGRAPRIVTSRRFTVAAIDARGHGGPPRTAHDDQEIVATQQARAAGEPVGPIVCLVQRLPGKARRPGMAGDPGRPPGTAGDRRRRAGRLLRPEHGHPDRCPADGGRTQDHRRRLRSVLARPGRSGKPDHHSDRVRLQWDDTTSIANPVSLFDPFASKERRRTPTRDKHKELRRFEADSALGFFAWHLRGTAHHRPGMTGIGVRCARQAPRVLVPLDPCGMEHVLVDPGRAREPEDHRGHSP